MIKIGGGESGLTPAAPEVCVMTTALIVFNGGTVFLQIFANYSVTLSSPAQISPAVMSLVTSTDDRLGVITPTLRR